MYPARSLGGSFSFSARCYTKVYPPASLSCPWSVPTASLLVPTGATMATTATALSLRVTACASGGTFSSDGHLRRSERGRPHPVRRATHRARPGRRGDRRLQPRHPAVRDRRRGGAALSRSLRLVTEHRCVVALAWQPHRRYGGGPRESNEPHVRP